MNANELHLTKKDFILEWFSGQGSGGQHRNKHKNCCRIRHIETGLKAQATGSKSRLTNQKDAFSLLASRLISFYFGCEKKRGLAGGAVIRNYHKERNEVYDKASGLRLSYSSVLDKGGINDMIGARRIAMNNK